MNYGLIISEPTPEDYILGGLTKLPEDIIQPDGQWDEFLPLKEAQNLFGVETQSCTSYGTLNCVEILLKKKWIEKNLSDRWLAQKSDTKPFHGNTPQKVCETLRKKGDCKQSDWGFTPDIKRPEDFYKEPPTELDAKAKKFIDQYEFLHEYVPTDTQSLKKALTYSPIGVSVFAWHNINGVYQKPQGARDNHWCVCYGWTDEGWKIFDSYDNEKKIYSFDAKSSIAKRFHLKKKTAHLSTHWLIKLWNYLLQLKTS